MEGLSKEELLYDERAERLRQIRAQRQRKMRKRRHIRNFFLLALLAGIVLSTLGFLMAFLLSAIFPRCIPSA